MGMAVLPCRRHHALPATVQDLELLAAQRLAFYKDGLIPPPAGVSRTQGSPQTRTSHVDSKNCTQCPWLPGLQPLAFSCKLHVGRPRWDIVLFGQLSLIDFYVFFVIAFVLCVIAKFISGSPEQSGSFLLLFTRCWHRCYCNPQGSADMKT